MHDRVDNIPFWLKPFFLLCSYILASLFYGLCRILHATCRVEFQGLENLGKNKNHIFCTWHHNLGPYFVTFIHHGRPYAVINHPLWFMKPIHILLHWIGIKKIILGSSGHSGKEAADQLVHCLGEGYSTFINPDGPHGPPKILKKGVLHLGLKSGVPVVPFKILTPHCITLNTWDHKRFPLPFSKLQVIYEKPVVITEDNFEEAGNWISEALG